MSATADELKGLWEHFKVQNDARLSEIEKFGATAAETEAKVNRIDEMMREIENRLNRPTSAPKPVEDSEKRAGFVNWLRTGFRNAALQEGTNAEGGYTVPIPMYNDIVKGIQELSVMRQAGARSINMTRWKMDIPTLTNSTAAILTAEEDPYSQVEPTFGTIQAVAYKYTKLSKVSRELLADSLFDVWGEILLGDFAHAFALAENTAFTTGSGDSQPQGVVTGASAGKVAASATAITGDEIIDLHYSLDYRHRPRARFMCNDAVAAAVRKLKISAASEAGEYQYLWTPGFGEAPDMILGRPVVINNSMDGTPAANDVVMLFGDFSYYWIFDRQGMDMQRLNELYAANGQVGFIADKRFDGHVMLSTAIKKLAMATA
jgi:HK97 family phage major capsid protein